MLMASRGNRQKLNRKSIRISLERAIIKISMAFKLINSVFPCKYSFVLNITMYSRIELQ